MSKSEKNDVKVALNIRQERFAELVASGVPASRAYIAAGYNVTEKAAEAHGSRLARNGKVTARIEELRRKTATAVDFQRQDLVKWLVEVITTPVSQIGPDSRIAQEVTTEYVAGGSRGKLKRGHAPSGNETTNPLIERIRVKGVGKMDAARLLTEIMGWKEPEQIVVETGPKTLDMLERRAAEVQSGLVKLTTPLSVGDRISPKQALKTATAN